MRPSTTIDGERTAPDATATARETRRRTLRLAAVAMPGVALAGCTDGGDADAGDGSDDGEDGADEPLPDDPEPVSVRLVGPEADRHLFDGDGVEDAGPVSQEDGRGHYYVPMTLTEGARESMGETFREAGVAHDHEAFELAVDLGDEELSRLHIAPGLAETVAVGDWEGRFRVTFEERETAERFRRHLVA